MTGIKRRLGTILGPEGRAPQIRVGATHQTGPDVPARVSITKTGEAAYRADFSIPQGRVGLPGPDAIPADKAVAAYLNATETDTHAAAKAITAPIVGGLQPTSLRSATESTTDEIFPLEAFGGYLWGFTTGGIIYRQPLSGGLWVGYTQAPVSATVMRILPTGDGEVLIASAKQVHKSSGWATGNPTWDLKVTANGVTNILRGGIAGYGSKFIVTSYAAGAGFPESRYVWISLDAGDTFEVKYDAVEMHGRAAADGSHMHAVEYDRWSDRFYVSEGHSNTADIAGLYASDDDGETWTRAEGMKQDPAPVTITATDNGLVCGSDHVDNGLHGVLRAAIPDEELEWVWEWRTGALGLNGFARHAFREPTTGLVYVAFRSNHPGVAPVIAAGSPTTGGLVYELTSQPESDVNRIESVVVPTPNRLVAHAIAGEGPYTTIEGKLGHPTARPVKDPGNVLGGSAPSGQSVTVGPQASSGQALRSVVVGVAAQLSDSATTQHNVVVGYGAKSDGTDSLALGYNATTTDSSIVIGSGAEAAFPGIIVVGKDVVSEGGGSSVAIGNSAFTRAQSVIIGTFAASIAASARTVAVGYNAKAHTDSVALGANTETSQSAQVAIGAKSLYIQNRSAAPAPRSDGGQLYVQDGNLYWRANSTAVLIAEG